MKSKTTYFKILAIILAIFASCGKKPETIVTELYKSIYDGEWEKASSMIIPDSLEDLTPNEIKFLGEEFSKYFPEGRAVETLRVDSASYNEDKNEIKYTVTVNFNDNTSFIETDNLRKNSEGIWKLVDYMPLEGEKIPFEINIFDFPMELKPNLKRAMIMVGAEREIPEYEFYAASYYLYAPYHANKEKYGDLIKKAANANYIPAMLELALRYKSYFFGDYKSEDYLDIIKKAADLGSLEAKTKLAWYQLNNKNGIPKDLKAAQETFQHALEEGIGEGAWGLGYMYGNGYIGKRDRIKALEYYKKGSDLGNSYASYNVGLYYENGWGVKRDLNESNKWYAKSSSQGNDNVFWIHFEEFKSKHPKECFETFLNNIKNGGITKYGLLAEFYETGCGVDQDIENAKKAYRHDAELSSDSRKEDIIRLRGFNNNTVIPIEEFKEIYN